MLLCRDCGCVSEEEDCRTFDENGEECSYECPKCASPRLGGLPEPGDYAAAGYMG